jgi:hypothetical protein
MLKCLPQSHTMLCDHSECKERMGELECGRVAIVTPIVLTFNAIRALQRYIGSVNKRHPSSCHSRKEQSTNLIPSYTPVVDEMQVLKREGGCSAVRLSCFDLPSVLTWSHHNTILLDEMTKLSRC